MHIKLHLMLIYVLSHVKIFSLKQHNFTNEILFHKKLEIMKNGFTTNCPNEIYYTLKEPF